VSAVRCQLLSGVYAPHIPSDLIMAIVIAPAMSMQASGNVGAINFTRWRGINVARTTFVYSDPNTPAQMSQRALLTSLAQAWGGLLSAANRETWADRAADQVFKNRLGVEYQPSGYQLFMKWNLQLMVISDLINYNAPTGIENVFIEELLIWVGLMSEVWVKLVDDDGNDIDCRAVIIFRAGPYASGGRRPIRPEYRLQTYRKPPTTWEDYPVPTGNYFWYKAFGVLDSGRISTTFEGQIYVP